MAKWLTSRQLAVHVAFALLIGMPVLARAESDAERSGARAAAEAGLAAYNGGRYSEALDLLRRAESLVHAPTHLLYMARASEKLGQLVQARELYLKASRESLPANAPQAFVDAQRVAQQEAAAIERRLPFLTIKTDAPLPNNYKVTLDEREVPNVLVGLPFPVNPGNHIVVAISESGRSGEPVKVTSGEGKRDSITLKLPADAAEAKAPAPLPQSQAAVQVQPAGAQTAPSPADHDRPSGKASSPILAYSAIGLGVVGATMGTVFLVKRGSKQSDANAAYNDCKTRICGSDDINKFTGLDKDAATAGTVAIVSYGVGAAALSAGLYLLFTAHPKQAAALQAPTFVPYVGLKEAGASFRF